MDNFTREDWERLLRLATDEAKVYRAFLKHSKDKMSKEHVKELEGEAEVAERLMLKVAEYNAQHWRDDDSPKAEVRAAREDYPLGD